MNQPWTSQTVTRDTLHRVTLRLELHSAVDEAFLESFGDMSVRRIDLSALGAPTRFEITSSVSRSAPMAPRREARVVIRPSVRIVGALGECGLLVEIRKARGRWPADALRAVRRRISEACSTDREPVVHALAA